MNNKPKSKKANINIEQFDMEDLDLSEMAKLAYVSKFNLTTIANDIESINNAIKKLPMSEDIAGQEIRNVLNYHNDMVDFIDNFVTEFVEEIDHQLTPMLEEIYRYSQKIKELHRDIIMRRKEMRDSE